MSKILYITPGCFDKGGISRYNRYQVSVLREIKGENNIRVISLFGPKREDFEEDFKVYWHGWGAGKVSKSFFILKILSQAYTWKPDVIWFGHINITEILARFKFLTKFTSVLNIYGLEVWSGLRPKVEEGFKAINYLISDCHFTANYVQNQNIRPKETIDVIWDCVDLNKFKPQALDDFYLNYNLPNPKHNPWILSLGRISHIAAHKGYDRLLKVFQNLTKTNENAVLIFVGQGDLISDLREQAKQLDIAGRVYFTGAVPETDLAKFYSAASVFTMVSDQGVGRGEGIPMTPLEAMACGTPVIVGNKDGSQEAVIDDMNGSCIDPFDFETHTDVILELLDNTDLRLAKGKAAVKMAHDYFSYEDFKAKHLVFLNKLNLS